MKKVLYIIYGGIFVAFLFLLFYAGNNKDKRLTKNDKSIQFDDSLIVANNILAGPKVERGKPSILIFLSVHCEYCDEAFDLLNTSQNVNNTNYKQICLFSETPDRIMAYVKESKQIVSPNIHIYRDSGNHLKNLFKVLTVPAIFVIKDRKVIIKGVGTDKISQIISELK